MVPAKRAAFPALVLLASLLLLLAAPTRAHATIPDVTWAAVTGTPVEGGTVHCNSDVTMAPDVQRSYAWYINGVIVAGGWGDQYVDYTIPLGAANEPISCLVQAANSSDNVAAGSPSVYIQGAVAPTIDAVAVIGAPLVGVQVTCSATGVNGAPTPTVTYEWLVDGGSVGTGATYTPLAADAGHQLSCTATATSGSQSAQLASSAVTVLAPTAPHATLVALTGTRVVGTRETCTALGVTGAPTPTVGYAWFRGATRVSTGRRHLLVKADLGVPLSCRATLKNLAGTRVVRSPYFAARLAHPLLCVVPKTRGLSLAVAKLLVVAGGCRATSIRVHSALKAGLVVGTTPSAGSWRALHTLVTIRVSKH